MLILNRRIGEKIMIGDSIVIEVVDIHGKQIRLGIQAPREIPVYREEIYDQIQIEKGKVPQEEPQEEPEQLSFNFIDK